MRKLLLVIAGLAGLLAGSTHAQHAVYDRYGGWMGLKGQRTGFFHAERIDGRWWLVTPEGNVFFSKGVTGLRFEGDQTPAGSFPYKQAALARYGSEERWAEATVRRLRQWGLNTAAGWSGDAVIKQGIAYTPVLGLSKAAPLATPAGNSPDAAKAAFPDVFDSRFRAAVDAAAKQLCAPRRDDPWLIGYFTDNELRWDNRRPSRLSLLEVYLRMAPETPGRTRAEAFLKERGRSDDTLTAEDRDAFMERVAREYFRVTGEAIRRYDPNHLILGCRFMGIANPPVLRAMGGFVDVVSINNYGREAPAAALAEVTQSTGKPVMITEFSFRAMDSGLPNAKGAGKPVATQQERADLFQRYAETLVTLPGCVGYHWFKYADQPKEGRRSDGENSNYGLVKIDDTPWEALTQRFRAVNGRIETLHRGASSGAQAAR